MKITAKVEYAVLAIFELAIGPADRQVQAREIAERQKIPLRFLEQILIQLKKAGLVKSVRGAAGGYLLARGPAMIRLKDVMEAVEGELTLIDPAVAPGSIVARVFSEIESDLISRLQSVTIQDLVVRKMTEDGIASYQI